MPPEFGNHRYLTIGSALLGRIETRTRLQYGVREPQGEEMSRLDYQQVTCRQP